jgi:hypothetical protein
MKAGDQVVCIDDTITRPDIHDKIFQQWIKEGEMYIIRNTSTNLNGGMSVLLKEVKNAPYQIEELGGKAEPRFMAERFQKIDEVAIEELLEETFEEEDQW